MICKGCGLPINGHSGFGIKGEDASYHPYQARCVELLRAEIEKLKTRAIGLQKVAEAALEALGCCDYGCEEFSGCDHKNCCPNDAMVIEALKAAGYSEKKKCNLEREDGSKCEGYIPCPRHFREQDLKDY